MTFQDNFEEWNESRPRSFFKLYNRYWFDDELGEVVGFEEDIDGDGECVVVEHIVERTYPIGRDHQKET